MTDEFGNSRDHADRETDVGGPTDDISSTMTVLPACPKETAPAPGGGAEAALGLMPGGDPARFSHVGSHPAIAINFCVRAARPK
jgi:hypothetical protein